LGDAAGDALTIPNYLDDMSGYNKMWLDSGNDLHA
jgi:hypothetical protein